MTKRNPGGRNPGRGPQYRPWHPCRKFSAQPWYCCALGNQQQVLFCSSFSPGVLALIMFPLRLTRTRISTLPRRRPAGTCTACRSAWTLQLILNILEYLLISFKTTSSTAGQLEPCWWSWISYNVILSRLMTWNGTVFQELATFWTTSSTASQIEHCSWYHLYC